MMSAPSEAISSLDHRAAFTFFPDWRAQTKRDQALSLREISPLIAAMSRDSKEALPWLKMARFGDKKTDKGSLRHNLNVLAISGIEGDYDNEILSIDEAVRMLAHAGIAGIIYASPSHTEDRPRWRVLCVLSREYHPAERDALLARLNGIFHGGLSGESFTLSQSYYYGSVRRSPSHRVELVDGAFLDLRGDLDDGAIGRARDVPAPVTTPAIRATVSNAFVEAVLRTVLAKVSAASDGQKHHSLRAQAKVLGGFEHVGSYSKAEAVQWLVSALPATAKDLKAAAATAAWGFEWGQAHPLDVPPPKNNVVRFPPTEPRADSDDPGWWQSIEREFEENQRFTGPEEPLDEAFHNAATPISPELIELLSIDTWIAHDIPEPDRLLGDVITTTTRAFFIGRTGLGKTLFGLGIGTGIASGAGFLHWRSNRPARVLYMDGEMPAELIKPRAQDALRRLNGARIPPGNLMILGRDIEEQAKRICPHLRFEPLNTEAGYQFLLDLIAALGKLDLIIFDNVMSLLTGNMKEEEPWAAVLPLVTTITARRIGQIWLDHTGHDSTRLYGTSTKLWRFDVAGIMTPPTEAENDPKATTFNLSFDYPGKARRRTPENWRDFAAQTISLENDQWVSRPKDKTDTHAKNIKEAPLAQYLALLDALVISKTPGTATRDEWYAECVRLGMQDPIPRDVDYKAKDIITKRFRTYMSDLKIAGWIGVDHNTITALKGRP